MKKTILEDIKQKMMDSLEEPDKEGRLCGKYICHADIPEDTPDGFDEHFVVVGDEKYKHCYIVCIQKIKL